MLFRSNGTDPPLANATPPTAARVGNLETVTSDTPVAVSTPNVPPKTPSPHPTKRAPRAAADERSRNARLETPVLWQASSQSHICYLHFDNGGRPRRLVLVALEYVVNVNHHRAPVSTDR